VAFKFEHYTTTMLETTKEVIPVNGDEPAFPPQRTCVARVTYHIKRRRWEILEMVAREHMMFAPTVHVPVLSIITSHMSWVIKYELAV